MSVWIHKIETVVPETIYTQEAAGEQLAGWAKEEQDQRRIRILHKKSGISKRHSVIDSYENGTDHDFFSRDAGGELIEPTTAERNEIFRKTSIPLICDAVDQVFKDNIDFSSSEVTHLITVSCTGFYNPGPDFYIVENCGLAETVQRYHVGFMGCYASMPAMDMARQFCEADKAAVVLVVSLELCSLHVQVNGGKDAMLANALFSDGVAACLISARPPSGHRSALRLGKRFSQLVPDGEGAMAWTIGDHGFEMVLSAYVPKIIGSNIHDLVSKALAIESSSVSDVDLWALHPGGKAIIESVQQALELESTQLEASRETLKNYGNMSSATILFVLKELLNNRNEKRVQNVCAIAFGPGLTVEICPMQLVAPVVSELETAQMIESI
jgi:predicted naringenin-chalcone synthase